MGVVCDWHLIWVKREVPAYVNIAAPCHEIHTCTDCMLHIRNYQQSWNCPHCGMKFTRDQVKFQ